MPLRIYKIISFLSGYFCIAVGLVHLLIWQFTIVEKPMEVGISYFGAFIFPLVGIGLILIYRPSLSVWINLLGAVILLLTLLKSFQEFFLMDPLLNQHLFFSSGTNPLNILGLALLGMFYLMWNGKNPSQLQFLSGIFIALSNIELAIMAFIAYALGFTNVYSNTHVWGMFCILSIGIALGSFLIYFGLISLINLYKWVPFTVGISNIGFFIIFAFFIHLNEQSTIEFSELLITFSLLGGTLTSIISTYFVYYFLLSKAQLMEVMKVKEELKLAKDEEGVALKSAEVGTWRWDIKARVIQWDEVTSQLLGINHETFEKNRENILSLIHPDDLASFNQFLNRILKEHYSPFDVTYRILWLNDTIHFLRIKGKILFDNAGIPSALTGIVADVSESKYTEHLLHLSISITRVLERAISINDAAKQLIGLFHHHFGWEVLAIWKRESPRGRFECLALETHRDFPLSLQIEQYQTDHIFGGDYFLEMLIENTRPIALENIGNEIDQSASISALQELRGGLIFPILESGNITGIIELFKRESYTNKIDSNFSDFLNATGISIREFILKSKRLIQIEEQAKIVTSSHEPIISCTLDGVILSWNLAAERTYGWQAKEIIGMNIQLLFPNDRLAEFEKIQETIQNGAENYKIQSQRKTKNGKLIWIDETYSILADEHGRKNKISIIANDISEETLARQALLRSEEKFRAFVESTDEWIWEMDPNGVFTYSNPAIEHILGYLPEEIIGQPIYCFIHEESKDTLLNDLENSIHLKKGWYHRRLSWKNKSGKLRILESTSIPYFNEKKQLVGFRGADQDVTEKVEIERNKNEFISMVSHEIKTPLTSIHGALGLLTKQKDLTTKTKDIIQLAYRNSNLLSHLLQDIVDIEKIDLGKFEFVSKKIVLNELIKEAIHSASLISEKKGVTLIETSTIPDIAVKIDPDRLMQVFFNLFSNAINISPSDGHIYISMERFGDKVRVSIRDEGPGIPDEFKQRIFGRFEQAYGILTNYRKGTGLGLNISKSIMERMGGSIGFTSKLNEGTTFYFELPIANEDIK